MFVGPTENWGFALLLGMIAVIAALVVQVHARPYEVPAANRLEEASLLATFLTWAVGLHFYNDEPLNEPWKLSLATLLILAINVVCVPGAVSGAVSTAHRTLTPCLSRTAQVHPVLGCGVPVLAVP